MTPAQIELAARELARMRGYEPDAPADYPLVPVGKCWEQMRPEIETFAQVGTAIAAAMQHEEKPPRKKTTTRKSRA
jgi:hypothetical protein